MKKSIALLLALAMAFALCACGGTTGNSADSNDAAETTSGDSNDAAETTSNDTAEATDNDKDASAETEEEESGEAEAAVTDFPTKQITVICPYAAGGASDVISRLYAAAMETDLGVSVIVENQTGASGAVGFEAGANAEADGYTITYVSAEVTTLAAMGYSEIVPEDYIFLGRAMMIPACLVVKADSEWETLDDFIAYAKDHPGEVTVANTGSGSFYHMGALKLEQAADVTFNHVPFSDGAATATAALLGGSVDSLCVGSSEVLTYVQSGEFKILAVLSDERCATFPDAPTAAEQGYDASSSTWGAFVVPEGTPDDVVDVLRAATEVAINSDDMKEALESRGFEHAYIAGDEFQGIAEQLCVENSAIIKEFGLEIG